MTTTQTPAPQRPASFPPQHQDRRPGLEAAMHPAPETVSPAYKAASKLTGKTAIITGGDSGIGRAVAVTFAKEGADVAIVFLNEQADAEETKRLVEQEGRRCLLLRGDIGDPAFCRDAVEQTVRAFGKLDIVVNNAAEQHPTDSIVNITPEQLERTFRTNVFGMFHLTRAAVPHLKAGAAIINTTSVTAFRGNPTLVDYASSKGAQVAFTRSLALQLAEKGIRVNAVAPGPVWTPLIPSTFGAQEVARFGSETPLKRAAQPDELAPAYVYLASEDSSYVTGQVLHVNGGEIVGG